MAKRPIHKASNKLIDLFKVIIQWFIGLRSSDYMMIIGFVGIYIAYKTFQADTNKKIDTNHIETKAIVSTVSDKSDKTHSNGDTIKMEVRALKKEVDSLLQKK